MAFIRCYMEKSSLRGASFASFMKTCGLELLILAAILGCAFFSNPDKAFFLPSDVYYCPLKKYTGYSCAGCGMTRGFIYSAHCRIRDAFRVNLFAFPFFLLLFLRFIQLIWKSVAGRYPACEISGAVWWILLFSFMIYGLTRLFLEIFSAVG